MEIEDWDDDVIDHRAPEPKLHDSPPPDFRPSIMEMPNRQIQPVTPTNRRDRDKDLPPPGIW